MFSVDINQSRCLLVISAAGHVTKDEVRAAAEQVCALLRGVAPGFRVLADFRWLESMHMSATPHIGRIMDALVEKQAGLLVRVIPNPHQDVRINILSQFRYGANVGIVTHETLSDALHTLMQKAQHEVPVPADRDEPVVCSPETV